MLTLKMTDLHPRTLVILLAGGSIGSSAAVPYFFKIFSPAGLPAGLPYSTAVLLLAILSAGLTLACVYLGLLWGTPMQLGAPRLQNWAWNKADPGGWRESFGWSVPLGLAVTAVVWISQKYWFAWRIPQLEPVPLWQGLSATLYGGTAEELVLRLFAMTAVAKLLMKAKFTRQRAIVTALFVSAALSFLFHIPAAMALKGFSWPMFGRTFVHHGFSGLIFGWLYWRRGIESSMIAHGLSDLLLRMILRLA